MITCMFGLAHHELNVALSNMLFVNKTWNRATYRISLSNVRDLIFFFYSTSISIPPPVLRGLISRENLFGISNG